MATSCQDSELQLGQSTFPITPDCPIVLAMTGSDPSRGEGGRCELKGKLIAKAWGGGGSILQDEGLWPGNICFPSNQQGDFCLPRMPKSCSGWGRAGIGLETSNAFSCTLGNLGLMWASWALSLFLPPVRSVRSSHHQLTSQFHSLTPAVMMSGGLRWDLLQLPLHPPLLDLD